MLYLVLLLGCASYCRLDRNKLAQWSRRNKEAREFGCSDDFATSKLLACRRHPPAMQAPKLARDCSLRIADCRLRIAAADRSRQPKPPEQLAGLARLPHLEPGASRSCLERGRGKSLITGDKANESDSFWRRSAPEDGECLGEGELSRLHVLLNRRE